MTIKDEVLKQIMDELYNALMIHTKLTHKQFNDIQKLTAQLNGKEEKVVKALLNTFNIMCLKKEYYEVNAMIQKLEKRVKERVEEIKKWKKKQTDN